MNNIDMNNIDDETIKKALNRFIKQKEMANNYYKKRYAEDTVFREAHKEKSRQYYNKHKEEIKEKYLVEKKYKNALRKYNYYKEKNELNIYIEKFPEDFNTYFKDI
tara:strand:+ start:859 stop:1176 length:318 start_codon:yes stop_codon:yes gene_type:complete